MNNSMRKELKGSSAPAMVPIRCSVCGEKFLTLYQDTMPGIVFATCRVGHKTSYRVRESSGKAG